MRVLFDHQIFCNQKYGGISRYFSEIIQFLRYDTLNKIDVQFSNICLPNIHINEVNNNHQLYRFIKKINFKGKNRIINKINYFNSTRLLRKNRFDIFHPTYYNPYFLKDLKNKPFVLTVYDLIHEIYPEMFHSSDNTAKDKKRLLMKAARIIAISEHTKKDIIDKYKIDPKKISVIYLGNSIKVKSADNINIDIPKRYILYVGDRHIYKNFGNFAEAINILCEKDKSLKIVCAGGKEFSILEKDMLKRFNLQNKILHFPVISDKLLSYFYKNALVFVFPSLYEGFGIPVLEAFSCGCPIALSNSSSLPEVGGDAAIYFDPNDKYSMKEAIEKIIYNKDTRINLAKKGYKQLKKFSWRKTARETLSLYKEVLKNG